ncbi:MAG: CSS-motif domain-containing protein, partial [Caulobacteraceae bacterium]
MNFFNRLAPLIVLTVCLTTALPILAAMGLAQHQAQDREQTYVAGLARQALAKAEATGQQLGAGARLINALPPSEVCSEKGLDLMRRIDLSSTLIQAVGHVEGNVMICSSLGGTGQFDLGAPDMRSSLNSTIRTHVKLLDPDRAYVVVGTGSFVGIVHRDLPLSFVESVPGLGLGAFNWSNGKLILERGQIDPQWIKANAKGDVIFRSGDHLVAIARSRTLDLGGIAALPSSHSSGFVREAAIVLVPLGLVTGLALSALLIRVMRERTSMPAM